VSLLFLIPARGGSKGFPGKNLATLAGIPLVGRAVRAARIVADELPGARVVCSTDDDAIAAAARASGAETPFVRPAALATDGARTLDVVRHAVDALDEPFEAVVLLQPTSPLTEPDDIRGALKLFRETRAPVISVCSAEHPVEWYHRLDRDGRLVPVLQAAEVDQRQKGVPSFRPNGAVYVASLEQVRNGGFLTAETRGFIMPIERSADVDVPADLSAAAAMLADQPVRSIEVAGRKIGPGYPCFVIAEAGVNHNGSLEMAKRLVDAAALAGADAVKFQTFKARNVISRSAPKADYQVANTGNAESQLAMAERLELTDEEHRAVFAHCLERGILYLSSPFDDESVDLLDDMGVAAFKIGSGELTNHTFLRTVARRGKPVLLSTGMADSNEIREAVEVIRGAGDPPLALFHCVSNYPTAPEDCNLAAMASIRSDFHIPVGWSDHTLGTHISVAAVARGAELIEKHFTLDRTLPGPDHVASLDPSGLTELVRTIRDTEAAIGTGVKRRQASEENTAAVARRSVHAAREIPAGHLIEDRDIALLRPGGGIPANETGKVVGRRAARRILAGVAIQLDDVQG
jgi:N-acetylneuraminate synthase/N,N'-diacetyllegionaminate synthase